MKKLVVMVILATVCQFTFGNTGLADHKIRGLGDNGYKTRHLIPGKGFTFRAPKPYTPSNPHYMSYYVNRKVIKIGGW